MWRAGRQNVVKVTEVFLREAYLPDSKGTDWQCSKLALVLQRPGENWQTSIRLTVYLALTRMSFKPAYLYRHNNSISLFMGCISALPDWKIKHK